jgi:hypothetical protein
MVGVVNEDVTLDELSAPIAVILYVYVRFGTNPTNDTGGTLYVFEYINPLALMVVEYETTG